MYPRQVHNTVSISLINYTNILCENTVWFKEVRHIEMPKKAPKKVHLLFLKLDIEMK